MTQVRRFHIYSKCCIFILILVLGISSCEESEKLPNAQIESFVHVNTLEKLVGDIQFSNNQEINNQFRTSGSKSKKIKSITPVPDEEGNVVYYIVNYKNGGFIILAADNRMLPVLAFSSKSSFPVQNGEIMPNGLVQWLFDKKEEVVEIRRMNPAQSPGLKKAWKASGIQSFINGHDYIEAPDPNDPVTDPEDPDCPPNSFTEVGPLLTTSWGQTSNYNDQAPILGCSNDVNQQPPTGCVATAMAQVMRFHQFPNNYNWANMPNNTGTNSTAGLMRDIGNAVNMDWGCNGSGADTENEAASSFRNDFGYSTASYADFNHTIVKQQLNWNRPVMLRGGRNTGWWFFGVYSDGHAWVCDGYRQYTTCTTSSLYLHMNWGWNGAFDDWYAFNNWNPGNNTFNYDRGMVYNIAP